MSRRGSKAAQGILRSAALVIAGGLGALAHVWIAAVAIPLDADLERPASKVVLDKDGGWLRIFATDDGGRMWRIPIDRDELPQHLVDAVLAFEDRRFYEHHGVDPLAVVRAMVLNVKKGRVVSGASTITMQVARMLGQRPRTLSSKLAEAFVALQLELRLSKDDILTTYFNLAPYGGNIEGVGAAAYFYYEKRVDQLSVDEAATLAALPNAPTLLRPDRGRDRLKKRRDDVIDRMVEHGRLDASIAVTARRMPIHARRRRAPLKAPHLSELARQHPDKRVKTAIDSALQRRAERLLDDHLSSIAQHGIENGAVVIIENATRAVRAYVGSRDFFDRSIQGQVDGARAHRSPGSTLKPFVYALAMDRGLITETTLLEDVPVQYPDWSPSNFDGKFLGVVSARTALSQSLNVPAVRVAAKLEPDGLVDFMRRAGMSTFAQRGRYGLAAVLGGCEVTLLELTNLYATLSQGGLHRPMRITESEPMAEAVRLLSPSATYIISDILTDVQRPDLPDVWRDSVSIPRLAWKTGTSYGRRDAWSIGYNRRYTVGVWIGNFDGQGVPELVGAGAAAPLLFSLAQVLDGAMTDPWIERPESVVRRSVCALSGAVASNSCPHLVSELAIEDISPRATCEMHVSLDVSDDDGRRLCSRCRHEHASHKEVHTLWPASVIPWLERAGIPVTAVPEHNAACEVGLSGSGPVIHAPMDGDEYVLRNGIPAEHQQIALLASAPSGSGAVFWFVDGQLLRKASTGESVMLDPVVGRHDLVAVDAEGRRARVRIRIRE